MKGFAGDSRRLAWFELVDSIGGYTAEDRIFSIIGYRAKDLVYVIFCSQSEKRTLL